MIQLTVSGGIIRIFGWCPSGLPLSRFLPLWHFTDTVIIILLAWWTNVFWPFTSRRYTRGRYTSFIIFITLTNTNVHAASSNFFLWFISLMITSFSLTIFNALFWWTNAIWKLFQIDKVTSVLSNWWIFAFAIFLYKKQSQWHKNSRSYDEYSAKA